MHVFRKLDELPRDLGKTVVSVGNFDGVHCAHQAVIKEVVRRGGELHAKSLAVTFEPHPTRIVRPDVAPQLLTPLATKLGLLGKTGLDAVLVLPFDRELSLMSPKDFADNVLSQKLHAQEVHEGANFHFGHRAEGNVSKLQEFGKMFGFAVHLYPEMKIRGLPVSSSSIRQLLHNGDVSRVRHLLGREFSIGALPASGRGYGHKYTVPTINLAHYDEAIPANGVYISRTSVAGQIFAGVTNIGNRPTFGQDSFAIESHLFDFQEIELNEDTKIELSFLRRLRAEVKWPDVNALKSQIAKDVARAQRFFRLQRALTHSASRVSHS